MGKLFLLGVLLVTVDLLLGVIIEPILGRIPMLLIVLLYGRPALLHWNRL